MCFTGIGPNIPVKPIQYGVTLHIKHQKNHFLWIWKAHYHVESVLHTWQGVSKNENTCGAWHFSFQNALPLFVFLFSHDIQRVLWKRYSAGALCKVTASEWAVIVSSSLFKAKEFRQYIPYFFLGSHQKEKLTLTQQPDT